MKKKKTQYVDKVGIYVLSEISFYYKIYFFMLHMWVDFLHVYLHITCM